MRTTKQTIAFGVSGLVVLAVAACGGGGGNSGSSPSSSASSDSSKASSSPPATSSSPTQSSGSRLSRARNALATAGDAVPHGRPYDLESERYQDKSVWDIKVASGKKPEYELYVTAGGDKVVHQEHKDSRDDDAAKALKAKISLADALKIADRHAKGNSLDEAEIDSQHDTVVWTAKFKKSNGKDREVVINAKSGKMIGTKTEED
jgi:uncharacterized membrane protein YkoI